MPAYPNKVECWSLSCINVKHRNAEFWITNVSFEGAVKIKLIMYYLTPPSDHVCCYYNAQYNNIYNLFLLNYIINCNCWKVYAPLSHPQLGHHAREDFVTYERHPGPSIRFKFNSQTYIIVTCHCIILVLVHDILLPSDASTSNFRNFQTEAY